MVITNDYDLTCKSCRLWRYGNVTAPPLVFSNLAYFLVLPCVGATFLVYVAHWLKHKGQFGDNQPSRVGSWLAAIWGFFGTCWLLGGVEIVGRHFVGPTIAAAIWAVEALGLPVVGVAAGAWWLTHNESKRPVARAVLIGVGTGLTHVACAAAFADFSWGLVPASIAFFVLVFFNLPSVRRDIGAWRQRRAKEHMFRAAVAPGSGFESLPLPTEVTGELQPSGNAARDGNPGVAASENGEDQPPSKEKVLFWQAVVEITRGPAWLPDHTQAALAYLPPVGGMSWLAEFLPNQAYAYHVTMDKGPRVEILARCATEDDALEVARTMFEEIRYRFRGVHGQVRARPGTARTFAAEARKGYAELAMPTPPFAGQLALVEKLASVTASTPHAVEFYILWRRPSWLQDLQARRQYRGAVNPLYAALLGPAANDLAASEESGERYAVRVFATAQLGEGDTEASLLGRLGAIQVGIENRHREAARWALAPAGAWQQVIACKFRGGRVIPPEAGRFDFPASLALPHGFILARESYTPLPGLAEDDPRYIVLGDVLVDGAPSTYKAYAAVAHLPTSVSVLGAPGHGKPTLIASVVDQLAAKCPGVGILIPNLAKAGEGARYPFARRVSWKDPHFGIPWFVEGSVHATACERFANNLTAVLGLKDPYPQIIQNALAWGDPRFAGVPAAGQVPASFRAFVAKLQAYIQAHPYAEDTQADIVRALENRIKRLDTAEFDEMTRLDRADAPFRWFEDWLLHGGRIFLDLHDAPELVKNFVTFTLFQLIQEHAPQAGGILRNLIIIDEAHKVFRRPADTDPYKAEVIAARRMNELLCDYLDELRSRGCALIISDQEPRNLVPAAYEKPGLKVYFHLSGLNAQLVLPDSPDRAVLDQLPNYEAVVHDGATGQFYSMQSRPPRPGTEPSLEEVERNVAGARNASERRLRGGSVTASGEEDAHGDVQKPYTQERGVHEADPVFSNEDSGQNIDLSLLKLEREILRKIPQAVMKK